MKFTSHILILISLVILSFSCVSEKPKSYKEVSFRIDESGSIWMQQEKIDIPFRQVQINQILGNPSREMKIENGPHFNVWDELGIMTTSVSDTVMGIRLYLFGEPDQEVFYPRNRFIGEIEMTQGVLSLNDDIELNNLGLKVDSDNTNFMYFQNYPNGLALSVTGSKPRYNKPEQVFITFLK